MARLKCDSFTILARLVACTQMLFFMVLTPFILFVDIEALFTGYPSPERSLTKKVLYYTFTVSAATISYSLFWAGFALFQATRKGKTAAQRAEYLSFWFIACTIFIILDIVANATLFVVGNYSEYLLLSWVVPLCLFSSVACALPLRSSRKSQRKLFLCDHQCEDDSEATLLALPADSVINI